MTTTTMRQPVFDRDMSGGLSVVFAGGGSGGHLYPSLSIAAALRRRLPGSRVRFFCTRRSIDADILNAAGETPIAQPVMPIPTRPWRLPAFWRAWRETTDFCRGRFLEDRPDVVIGSGGFASAPGVVVAQKMGVATALLNPDVEPGRANRFLARRVKVILSQWAQSREHFAAVVVVRSVGCPIRADFARADRQAGIEHFGLDGDKKTLLVTGASQGAKGINRAMVDLAGRLAKFDHWQVLHLSGAVEYDVVNAAYRDSGCAAVCRAYTERMADALAAADLVVSRAGASTLAEITALGKPSILVPYPYDRAQHQLGNAKVLSMAGAARICRELDDADAMSAAIMEQLALLMCDGDLRAKMADNARLLGKIDAAGAIVDELVALAGRCEESVAAVA